MVPGIWQAHDPGRRFVRCLPKNWQNFRTVCQSNATDNSRVSNMTDMTASTPYIASAVRDSQQRQMMSPPGFGGSIFMRGMCFCFGTALFVAAVGLWAFVSFDYATMMIKLGASIVLLGCATVFLLMAIAPHDFYRVEFNPTSGNLYVYERDQSGRFLLERRVLMADITQLTFRGGALKALGREREVLLAIPMRRHEAQQIICAVKARLF